MPIGPALPPHLAQLAESSSRSTSPEAQAAPQPVAGSSVPRSTTPQDSDDEDVNDFGPALPPHLAAKRKAKAAVPAAFAVRPFRPEPSSPPRRRYEDDGEESEDDFVGPMPTPSTGPEKSAVQEFMEREERRAKEREVARVFFHLAFRSTLCGWRV